MGTIRSRCTLLRDVLRFATSSAWRHTVGDDKSKRHPEDGKLIDRNDPKELRNWSKSLGRTPEEVEDAIDIVGPSASAVRKWFDLDDEDT